MAAGITGDSVKDLILSNIMYDYQEIPNETYQFKDYEIQVNYNVELNYRNYNLEIWDGNPDCTILISEHSLIYP